MTLEELETLLKRAEDVLGKRVQVTKAYGGKWNVYIEGGPIANDLGGATLNQVVAKLKQWATPPKPDMLPVLVPIATAEFSVGYETASRDECVKHSQILCDIFREALKPYQP